MRPEPPWRAASAETEAKMKHVSTAALQMSFKSCRWKGLRTLQMIWMKEYSLKCVGMASGLFLNYATYLYLYLHPYLHLYLYSLSISIFMSQAMNSALWRASRELVGVHSWAPLKGPAGIVHVCRYVYIYIYICARTVYTVHIYIYTHSAHIHIYTVYCLHASVCIHTYIYVHICIWYLSIYMYIHIYIYIYTHTHILLLRCMWRPSIWKLSRGVVVRVHVKALDCWRFHCSYVLTPSPQVASPWHSGADLQVWPRPTSNETKSSIASKSWVPSKHAWT